MIIFKNNNTDPYFNIASEEYLIDNYKDDVFMLWRNSPAVIIGRNQNAYAEINQEFVTQNNIAVVRRLTGGGAVFHDLGNVNFTYITNHSEQSLDFDRFTRPVINALNKLGINATLSGRNDIAVDGMKISGNAQCVRNGRLMHHGTLLFSAAINDMSQALRPDPDKIASKGIDSIRARVTNIQSYIPNIDIFNFMSMIEDEFDGEVNYFSDVEISAIKKLADEKYSSWDWNYGLSKLFSHEKKKRFDFGSVSVRIDVKNGVLSDVKIEGDFFGTAPISELEKRLVMKKYERNAVLPYLDDISRFIAGSCSDEICDLLF